MRRSVPSVLAHILASSTLLACGGAVTDLSNGEPAKDGTTSEESAPKCSDRPYKSTTPACADVWHHPCGLPSGVDPSDGLSDAECNAACGVVKDPPNAPRTYWGCRMEEGTTSAVRCYTCIAGRRPADWSAPARVATIAGWLAEAAELERVSIDAFRILHRELREHEAPCSLLALVRAAERDEVRHTRILEALARREGAIPRDARVAHAEVRALVDIALENAVEGCVRETYGALVAGWQARHAGRDVIRRAMKRIHVDETRHADLAWRAHAWIMERLSDEDRAHVEQALQDAVGELATSAFASIPQELVRELGLPSPAVAAHLVASLRGEIFDTARAA